jgi:NO-binding membrane sensor protein with MHYT domain
MYRVLTCLTTEHDWRLVVLAGTVCWLASAAAISLFHRARASRGRTRAIWIGLDAAVGGCGIWATHFVAMLAYDPGAGAGYNVPVTLLSLFFAITIVAIGLCVALSSARQSMVALGGAVIGGGVAAMHYTGMAALELPAFIVWSPGIVVASVVFGSLFAAMACFVAVRRDDSVSYLAAAGLLTVAIVSHHFTAMGAVTLIPDPTLGSDGCNVSPTALSFLTSVAAFAILGISLLAAMFDRAAKGELHQQKDPARFSHRQHVAGTLHVRCGWPHPAVQPALCRTHGPDRHAASGPLADRRAARSEGGRRWDGDPDEFFAAWSRTPRPARRVTRR